MGGRNCQFHATGVKYMKLQELAVDVGKGSVASNALQYFAKNQIGQPERLAGCLSVKPRCVRINDAAKIIDPYSCIDDHHCANLLANPAEARFAKISCPLDLASQAPDTGLRVRLHQEPQGCLYRGFLGRSSAVLHRFFHQAIVDFNIGSHLADPLMCKYLIFLCTQARMASQGAVRLPSGNPPPARLLLKRQ